MAILVYKNNYEQLNLHLHKNIQFIGLIKGFLADFYCSAHVALKFQMWREDLSFIPSVSSASPAGHLRHLTALRHSDWPADQQLRPTTW